MSVHVLGSLNVDVIARAERLPGPGETVLGHALDFAPGGKGANQAIAVARLGGTVAMLGAVGQDDFGERMRQTLAAVGVDLYRLRTLTGKPTGTALITVAANGDNQITVFPGANHALTPATFAGWQPEPGDVLLSQFEVPVPVVIALMERTRTAAAISILNTAPAVAAGRDALSEADILVMNESEAIAYLGARNALTGTDNLIANNLRGLMGAKSRWIILTRGASGVLAVSPREVISVPGRQVKAIDTVGAGDCFCGALALALSNSQPMDVALRFANTAASLCVQRYGAGQAMPTLAEVQDVMRQGG